MTAAAFLLRIFHRWGFVVLEAAFFHYRRSACFDRTTFEGVGNTTSASTTRRALTRWSSVVGWFVTLRLLSTILPQMHPSMNSTSLSFATALMILIII